jgi:polysaccharide export outer membrane protein
MRRLLCILWVPVLFAMGSCSTARYPVTNYGYEIPDSLFDRIEYRLRPGDKITVQSFNNLSSVLYESTINNAPGGSQVPVYEAVVDNEGYIPVPRATDNRVKVGGLTQREAAREVNKAYKKIINDPEFDLVIASMKVNVLGAVNTQGSYLMTRENMTLADAFALAGGVKYENMGRKLMIIRDKKVMQFKMNPAQLSNPRLNAIIIKDDDVVVVKPSGASINAPRVSQYASFLAPISTIISALTLYTTIQTLRNQ